MTFEELQKLVEESGVKINHLAQLHLAIASTVEDGLKAQLQASKVLQASVENLLETSRLHKQILASHEGRISGLENQKGAA